MKIVVLDGYTLNPGDLSWEALDLLEVFSDLPYPALVSLFRESHLRLLERTWRSPGPAPVRSGNTPVLVWSSFCHEKLTGF